MDELRVEDLWGREAYDSFGRRIGVVEAVGMRRDGHPRRVGVRRYGDGSALRFFALAGARVDGSRLVLAADTSLEADADSTG